jgi:PadR family transcriptional regulator AphA
MVSYVDENRRMSLKYALLAGLALEPRSGYDLAHWFGETASYYWSATHSSIYPALAMLEREQLVTHTVVPSAQGPARKVYTLTLRGHDALLAWLDTPAAPPTVRDEEALKALCYGLLPPAQARAQLEATRERHAANLAHYKEAARRLDGGEKGDGDGDGDGERWSVARLGLSLTLRRGIDIEKGYIAWCDEAVDLLTAAAEVPRRAEEQHRKGKDKDRDKHGKKKRRDKR